MSKNTVESEYDKLESVRVHKPGVETFFGNLDYKPNLFLDSFSREKAQEEHDRVVEVLENEGVEVHRLYEDLHGEPLDQLLDDLSEVDTSNLTEGRPNETPEQVRDNIRQHWKKLPDREKLQMILTRPELARLPPTLSDYSMDSSNMDISERLYDNGDIDPARQERMNAKINEPITNMFFQRDQQFVGDRGVVMSRMAKNTRQPEIPISSMAWKNIGADVYEPVRKGESIEGGEFIPADDFALIGVGSDRTSYAAAKQVIESEALGYDEVALVKAPLEEANGKGEENAETDMDLMHLDTWFNIAAEGIAVTNTDLVTSSEVDVYHREGDSYTQEPESMNFMEFLESRGYNQSDMIDVEYESLPESANFLTIDDGKVLPIYREENYHTRGNDSQHITDAMKDAGIEVLPDGEGLELDNLTNGYGGVHCMTTPIERS